MSRFKNYSYLIVVRKVLKPILFELESSCCILYTGPVFFMLVVDTENTLFKNEIIDFFF